MSKASFKIRNPEGIYFISFAVVEWVDVFTRKDYRDILITSLGYCQTEKELRLHAWCIMSNHVHLIASADNGDLSGILRDFKKYTSSELIRAVLKNPQESRKDWMLEIFRKAGNENS